MRARFVFFLCAAACGPYSLALPARGADDVAGLIRKQSKAFSDASAAGNAAVLDRLLDRRVAFMNEDGTLSSKKDVVDGAGPPPPGVSNTFRQTDFRVRVLGNVAVTTFTEVSTVDFHGQHLGARYRSTEVWLDEAGGWKMISSQTIALNTDPPAVVLPATQLDEYVGTYRAGPGYAVAIVRSDTGLRASVNGGPSVALEAELRDVFFVPGQPRVRRIFRRDANGAITGFVSRREGRDVVLERIPER